MRESVNRGKWGIRGGGGEQELEQTGGGKQGAREFE